MWALGKDQNLKESQRYVSHSEVQKKLCNQIGACNCHFLDKIGLPLIRSHWSYPNSRRTYQLSSKEESISVSVKMRIRRKLSNKRLKPKSIIQNVKFHFNEKGSYDFIIVKPPHAKNKSLRQLKDSNFVPKHKESNLK